MADKRNLIFYSFRALERSLTIEDYRYVLNELYHMLCCLKRRNTHKAKIMAAVKRFEKNALLPTCLSSLSVDDFLEAFEEALYRENFRGSCFYMPSFEAH